MKAQEAIDLIRIVQELELPRETKMAVVEAVVKKVQKEERTGSTRMVTKVKRGRRRKVLVVTPPVPNDSIFVSERTRLWNELRRRAPERAKELKYKEMSAEKLRAEIAKLDAPPAPEAPVKTDEASS